MTNNLERETPKVPTDPRALRRLERHIELGELEEIPGLLPFAPRYLVTYMKSVTSFRVRSATVVSVTNQSPMINRVSVPGSSSSSSGQVARIAGGRSWWDPGSDGVSGSESWASWRRSGWSLAAHLPGGARWLGRLPPTTSTSYISGWLGNA
jgi:hypothetical protein